MVPAGGAWPSAHTCGVVPPPKPQRSRGPIRPPSFPLASPRAVSGSTAGLVLGAPVFRLLFLRPPSIPPTLLSTPVPTVPRKCLKVNTVLGRAPSFRTRASRGGGPGTRCRRESPGEAAKAPMVSWGSPWRGEGQSTLCLLTHPCAPLPWVGPWRCPLGDPRLRPDHGAKGMCAWDLRAPAAPPEDGMVTGPTQARYPQAVQTAVHPACWPVCDSVPPPGGTPAGCVARGDWH